MKKLQAGLYSDGEFTIERYARAWHVKHNSHRINLFRFPTRKGAEKALASYKWWQSARFFRFESVGSPATKENTSAVLTADGTEILRIAVYAITYHMNVYSFWGTYSLKYPENVMELLSIARDEAIDLGLLPQA